MQARRRRLVAVLGAGAALLGLTACDAPTPLVTVYSGARSIDDDAFSYCFEGQDPGRQPGEEGACRYDTADGRTAKVLAVRPGDPVKVDVSKDLRDTGWIASTKVGDADETRSAIQTEHVLTFSPDFSQGPAVTLNIRKVSGPADNAKVLGLWSFTLVPR